MNAVTPARSRAALLGRVAIVSATGLIWAGRSIQEVLGRPAYWNPATGSDVVAVVAYSSALVLTAASLLVLAEFARPWRPLVLVIVRALPGSRLIEGWVRHQPLRRGSA